MKKSKILDLIIVVLAGVLIALGAWTLMPRNVTTLSDTIVEKEEKLGDIGAVESEEKEVIATIDTSELKGVAAEGTKIPENADAIIAGQEGVTKMEDEKQEKVEAERKAQEEAERAEQAAREAEQAKQESAQTYQEPTSSTSTWGVEYNDVDTSSYIYQLASQYIGMGGMCETISINFDKAYLGVTVVYSVNTYEVYDPQPGDMVVYSYGHQGVYLGGNTFLNPNNNGTTTISNIYDYGTPTFHRWNGESAEIACINATDVGYGYQSIAGTSGCDETWAFSQWFWYLDEIGGWTNDTRVLDSYGYSY